MNSNLKKVLGVLLLIIIIAVVYPWYSKHRGVSEKELIQDTTLELGTLIVKQHDCNALIEKATAFLKTHPLAEEVWSLLGSCQFDQGLFADAKTSFNKVLSINPDNTAAQNYLKQMTFKPGEVVVTAAEVAIPKAEFETGFGTQFEPTLSFIRAVRKPASIPLYLFATYTSSKSKSQTVSALKTLLKGIDITGSETDTGTILAAGNAMEIRMIRVKNPMNGQITVEMEYQKLQ